ncbi:MAG: hypothetical protein ABSB42_07925 [Tepidisphaeraceae bacterium]|jgi:hypothetical protein
MATMPQQLPPIILKSPYGGIVRSVAREDQPPNTAVDGINCLPYDPWSGRKRVSQRPGSLVFASTGQSTYVQGLLNFAFVIPAGAIIPPLPAVVLPSNPIGGASTSGSTTGFPSSGSVTFFVLPASANTVQASAHLAYTPYATDYIAPYPAISVTIDFGNIAALTITSQGSTDGTNDYVWLNANGVRVSQASVQYGGGPPNGSTLSVAITLTGSYQGLQTSTTLTATGALSTYTQALGGSQLNPSLSTITVSVTGNGAGGPPNPISTSSVLIIS